MDWRPVQGLTHLRPTVIGLAPERDAAGSDDGWMDGCSQFVLNYLSRRA